MIRFVTPEWESELIKSCGQFGIFDCKIYSQYQTYGAQSGVVDFWLVQDAQGHTIGLLSRLEGRFTAAAKEQVDTEELSWFLQRAGSRSVEGEQPLIARLFPDREQISAPILRQDRPPDLQASADRRIIEAERLSDVFQLLCESDPQFANQADYTAWLAEASHKVRHRLAHIFILKINHLIVSTVSIIFLSPRRAILAGVATHPAQRGRGYGRMAVEHACRYARQQGQQPWVFAANDGLEAFYTGCGFSPAGRWARMEWEGDKG